MELTKDDRSLLLYLESRAVDNSGAVHTQHMNADDMAIAEKWNADGFVSFGRIASEYLPLPSGSTHWCVLSEAAWQAAHDERQARAIRGWNNRIWKSTTEKRSEVTA